ncbi:MAG: hypothetical protein ACT4PY_06470 [Armatimonadota bacterium]
MAANASAASEAGAPLRLCVRDAVGERYLDFRIFKALRDLVPELGPVRFAGLTEAGLELWEQGQMRVPIAGNFLKEDVNRDGKVDCAILFEARAGSTVDFYIVLASPSLRELTRLFLLRLEGPAGMGWDKRRQAIEIDTGVRRRVTSSATMRSEGGRIVGGSYGYAVDIRLPAYLRWNPEAARFDYARPAEAPFRPWNVTASLASYSLDYAPADFAGVHIAFTSIGWRRWSGPNLQVFPAGYLPNAELFALFRRPGVAYRSDGAGGFRSLGLAPEQTRAVVLAIAGVKNLDALAGRTGGESPAYSVSVLDVFSDKGPNFSEILLTVEETRSLLSRISQSLRRQRPDAARALEDYQRTLSD